VSKLKNSKLFKQIATISFYVLSGFLILYIFTSLVAPDAVIKVFQFRTYTVLTKSMEPVIKKDDLAFVFNVNVDKLEEGDIITFMADIDYNGEKELVTHYIHSINEYPTGERFFKTIRHDSITPDTWELSDEDIIGKYGFKLNQMGLFVNFLKSGFGIATITVNIVIIGAIIYILKSGKKDSVQSPD
jgi:signal peptidase I